MAAVSDVREVVLPARRGKLGAGKASRAVGGIGPVAGAALARALARPCAGLPDIDADPVVEELVPRDENRVLVTAARHGEAARTVQVDRAAAVRAARSAAVTPAAVHEQVAGDVEVVAGLAEDARAVVLVEVVALDQGPRVPVVQPDDGAAPGAVADERVADDVRVERPPPLARAGAAAPGIGIVVRLVDLVIVEYVIDAANVQPVVAHLGQAVVFDGGPVTVTDGDPRAGRAVPVMDFVMHDRPAGSGSNSRVGGVLVTRDIKVLYGHIA